MKTPARRKSFPKEDTQKKDLKNMFTLASSVELERKGGSLGNGGSGRVTRRYSLRVTDGSELGPGGI